MALKLKRWDLAGHLKTEEGITLHLQACFEEAGGYSSHALRYCQR